MRALKSRIRKWLLPELPELRELLEWKKRLALERALRAQVGSAKTANAKANPPDPE
ncbi:hypothetical protein [Stenotrophomonas maltophilia]|uniref:hypothetical protein n=1 Tax=Stenotrophomonas maltophilia TaxID=40324 RepID=UPI00166125D4|nr:hypothetical protein [Stenotrophomonas maltophilia]